MKMRIIAVLAILILAVVTSGCVKDTGTSTGSNSRSSATTSGGDVSAPKLLMPSASEIGAGFKAIGKTIVEDEPSSTAWCPYSESNTFQIGTNAESYTIEMYKCRSEANAAGMVSSRKENYRDFEQLPGYGEEAWIRYGGELKGAQFYRTIIKKGVYYAEIEGHTTTKEKITVVTGVVAGKLP